MQAIEENQTKIEGSRLFYEKKCILSHSTPLHILISASIKNFFTFGKPFVLRLFHSLIRWKLKKNCRSNKMYRLL